MTRLKRLRLAAALILAAHGTTSAATLKESAYGSSVAIFANTELASLASGNWAFANGGGLSTHVFDNTTGLYPEADVVCSLGSITPSATGPAVNIAFMWSLDGTTFPDPQYNATAGTGNAPLGATDVYAAGVLSGASAKVVVFRRILLRPGKAQIVLGNQTGVSFNASSNTCTLYPATYTII